MLANDIDDARCGLLGIVQIGDAVAETRAEMQQGAGRRALHSVVAVGSAGHDTFEQSKNTAHAVDPVERRDKMHFRRSGIGETDIDTAADQGPHQAFRTVHDCAFIPDSRVRSDVKTSLFAADVKRFTRRAARRPAQPPHKSSDHLNHSDADTRSRASDAVAKTSELWLW